MAIRDNLVVLERLRDPEDRAEITLGKLREIAREPIGVGFHVERFLTLTEDLPARTKVVLTPGKCSLLDGTEEIAEFKT